MNTSEQLADHHQSGDGGDMSDIVNYFRTLYRFRWYVITILAASLSLGVFYTAGLKDEYRSKCSILIDDTQVRTTSYAEAAEGAPNTGNSKEFIDTQLVIATSIPVLIEVAKELDAKKYFNVDSDQSAAEVLQKSTTAYQHKKTNIFHIEVVDYDRVWSAKFANSIAKHYVQENLRQSLMTNQQLLRLLPGGSDTNPNELIQKMSDPYFIENLPSVQGSAIIQDLKKEKLRHESELARLRTKYTDINPIVIEVIQNIQHVEDKIKLETANIVAGLKRNLSSEFKSTNMSIYEIAKVPKEPSGPNRIRILLAFLFGGLVLASCLSVFMNALIATVNQEEDLAQLVNIPYLGHLPRVDAKKGAASIQDLMGNQSVRDAVAMLHTALVFSMPKDRNKLIMVTSCVPGEGKSSVSVVLAYAMASLGSDSNRKVLGTEDRILLIEADIRRPWFDRKLGLEGAAGGGLGLSDYLTGKAEYKQIIQHVPGLSNLDVITAGSLSKNPEGLFTSTAFDDLVKMVEKDYTRVIFDSPPFLSIPEAAIISQKVHGTLFVVGSGMLNRRVLMRAIDKLRLLNTNLFGTVLNRFDTHHEKHYHGYKYKLEAGR